MKWPRVIWDPGLEVGLPVQARFSRNKHFLHIIAVGVLPAGSQLVCNSERRDRSVARRMCIWVKHPDTGRVTFRGEVNHRWELTIPDGVKWWNALTALPQYQFRGCSGSEWNGNVKNGCWCGEKHRRAAVWIPGQGTVMSKDWVPTRDRWWHRRPGLCYFAKEDAPDFPFPARAEMLVGYDRRALIETLPHRNIRPTEGGGWKRRNA